MLEKWKNTDNYMGKDYSNYYVLYAANSCSTLTEWSNFISILNEIENKFKYEIVIFRHWALGKIFSILLPDEKSKSFGEKIIKKIEEYPIYNESIFEELQNSLINKILENSEDSEDSEEAYEQAYEDSFEVSVYQFLHEEIDNIINKYKK